MHSIRNYLLHERWLLLWCEVSVLWFRNNPFWNWKLLSTLWDDLVCTSHFRWRNFVLYLVLKSFLPSNKIVRHIRDVNKWCILTFSLLSHSVPLHLLTTFYVFLPCLVVNRALSLVLRFIENRFIQIPITENINVFYISGRCCWLLHGKFSD